MIRRYMRMDELATEFGVSIDFVREIRRLIRKNMKACTRYGPIDIIGTDKPVAIRTAAYLDAVKYKNYLGTNMEDMLPVYDPLETEYELGLAEREIDIDKLAVRVWEAIKTKLAII